MAVQVRSVPQILSGMVRRVLTDSPLTDVNPGSVIATLLEAASMSDYQNSLAVIKVLESSKLEALVGTDLDSKAIEMNLPNGVGGIGRKPATRSSGVVTIGSPFTKKATTFYLGKPAPYTGATTVYLQDCTGWPTTGSFYIGRGSTNEEGPIQYTSLTNNGGYFSLVLAVATPLLKPHRYDEQAVLSQGGVRVIPAGTRVYVPPTDNTIQIEFASDYSVKLLDGEAEVDVKVTCMEFGENGNVIAGSVKSYSSTPFTGATITNAVAFSNGASSEADEALRQRIRNYTATLSKGTSTAITASIQGLRDAVSGKTVTSVSIVEPITVGEPAKCYIDDGTGLEPAYEGQSFENLLSYSSGRETLFRTSKAPITPCQIVGTKTEPYALVASSTFTVVLEGLLETFTVYASDFVNLNSVTASEIVNAFNTQAVNVAFRTTEGGKKIVVFDMNGQAETMRVYDSVLTQTFGMSTEEIRPLFLFQNNKLLSYTGNTALLQTAPFPWPNLTGTAMTSVQVRVDGVTQTFTVTDADFSSYPATMSTATPTQWAAVLATKIAGVKITVSQASGGATVLLWESWQANSSKGSLDILTGSWVGTGKMWTSVASSVGSAADYEFNRLTGQLRLITAPLVGDRITVASQYTRSQITSKSAPAGVFSLGSSLTVGSPRLVVGFDGDFAIRSFSTTVSSSATVSATANPSVALLTLVGASALGIVAGDYVYLAEDNSLGSPVPTSCIDIYRVVTSDGATLLTIEGGEAQITALVGLGTLSLSTTMCVFFKCNNTLPQIIDLGAAGSLPSIDTIIAVANPQFIGGKLVKLSPRELVLTSCNYTEGTTVALFATIGTASNLFIPAIQTSIQPHTASASSDFMAGGFAKVQGVVGPTYPNAYYPRRGWLSIDKTFTNIAASSVIEAASGITSYPIGLQEMAITGRNAGLVSRMYNLDSVAPYSGQIQSTDVIYPRQQTTPGGVENVYGDNVGLRLEDAPFSFTDNLVVEMNQDPINGTSVIGLFKKASIATMTSISAGSLGSLLTFTLKDPDDSGLPFFDNASAFKTFNFADFNILFRSNGLHYIYDQDANGQPIYPAPGNPKSALLVRSTQYGDASKVRLSFLYGQAPNQADAVISHITYSENQQPINHVYVTLPTGTTKGSYLYNYSVTPSSYDDASGSKIVKYRLAKGDISFPEINVGLTFVKGDILVIGGSTAFSGGYLITDVDATWIDVVAPGVRATSYSPTTLQVGNAPLYSLAKKPIKLSAIVTALNDFSPTNPVVSCTAYAVDANRDVVFPSYLTQGNTVANTGLASNQESINYHAVNTAFGCKAHIYLYDALLGQVKALVQYVDPVLPTSAQRADVAGYTSYVDELCYIVPSNLTSLNRWLNFTAVSSLTFNAEIDRVATQSKLQISALETGSNGAILITGLNADRLTGLLNDVPLEQLDGTFKYPTNFAISQSLPRGSLVEITNTIALAKQRPYATSATDTGGLYSLATAANNQRADVFFRPTTKVVYKKASATQPVRLFFLRSLSGYDSGLGATNTLTYTKVSDYVVKVEATGTNSLGARVGDMLAISSASAFPSYAHSYNPVSETTDYEYDAATRTGYPGYPVVHVESATICYVIAPNIAQGMTTPVAVILADKNDIYFMPNLVSEKNIRTNYKAGALWNDLTAPGEQLHYRIKPIGLGFVYCEFSSTSSLNNLDMELAGLMVNTDDYIEFGPGFQPIANQGVFRIVAHNGRNAVIFKNDVAEEALVNNSAEWGLVNTSTNRQVRIWDNDSLVRGDRLVINSPQAGTTSWFDSSVIGTWPIQKIYITGSVNNSGSVPEPLPSPLDTDIGRELNMLIELDIPNAPSGTFVFDLGLSASSIGFTEPDLAQGSTRVVGYKWTAGYGANVDATLGDTLLAPITNTKKMLPQYGTTLSALYKTAFPQLTSVGIDGYRYYTELIAECHKVIDGSSVNVIDYPGVRSAGSAVEVLAPLIRRIKASLSVTPKEGVSINSIKQSIKSVCTAYVNGLGVGKEVIVSEIIKSVQQIPGVKSVEVTSTNPAVNSGIISVGSFEVARVLSSDDITL